MKHCDSNGLRRPVELICWAARRANTEDIRLLGPSHSQEQTDFGGLGSGCRLGLEGWGLGCQEVADQAEFGLGLCCYSQLSSRGRQYRPGEQKPDGSGLPDAFSSLEGISSYQLDIIPSGSHPQSP